MSRINGDKARFNIRRKKKIQRRIQKQEMLGALSAQAPPAPASRTKSEAKSA